MALGISPKLDKKLGDEWLLMKQKILTEKDRVTIAQHGYTKIQKNTPIQLKELVHMVM